MTEFKLGGDDSTTETIGKTNQKLKEERALFNGTLVRYLDFNDSFLSKGETCHPSDNVAPVLAASEYAGHSKSLKGTSFQRRVLRRRAFDRLDTRRLGNRKANYSQKYNSEVHSQSAVECILQLKLEFFLKPAEVESIEVRIFHIAYKIIGGGEEGEKMSVQTKEQADHSIPYILAVALCDGEVMPAQYSPERI